LPLLEYTENRKWGPKCYTDDFLPRSLYALFSTTRKSTAIVRRRTGTTFSWPVLLKN